MPHANLCPQIERNAQFKNTSVLARFKHAVDLERWYSVRQPLACQSACWKRQQVWVCVSALLSLCRKGGRQQLVFGVHHQIFSMTVCIPTFIRKPGNTSFMNWGCDSPCPLQSHKSVGQEEKTPINISMFGRTVSGTNGNLCWDKRGPFLGETGTRPRTNRPFSVEFHSKIAILSRLSLGRWDDCPNQANPEIPFSESKNSHF